MPVLEPAPEEARWARFTPRSKQAVRASLILCELEECGPLSLDELVEALPPGDRPGSIRNLVRNVLGQLEYDGVVERLTRGGQLKVTKWVLERDPPLLARAGGDHWPTPGAWPDVLAAARAGWETERELLWR